MANTALDGVLVYHAVEDVVSLRPVRRGGFRQLRREATADVSGRDGSQRESNQNDRSMITDICMSDTTQRPKIANLTAAMITAHNAEADINIDRFDFHLAHCHGREASGGPRTFLIRSTKECIC